MRQEKVIPVSTTTANIHSHGIPGPVSVSSSLLLPSLPPSLLHVSRGDMDREVSGGFPPFCLRSMVGEDLEAVKRRFLLLTLIRCLAFWLSRGFSNSFSCSRDPCRSRSVMSVLVPRMQQKALNAQRNSYQLEQEVITCCGSGHNLQTELRDAPHSCTSVETVDAGSPGPLLE